MSDNDVDTTRSIPLNTWMLAVLGAIVIYMIWIGISGAPIPEWVYWITTIL